MVVLLLRRGKTKRQRTFPSSSSCSWDISRLAPERILGGELKLEKLDQEQEKESTDLVLGIMKRKYKGVFSEGEGLWSIFR